MPPHRPVSVRTRADIRAFFDALADDYRDRHGGLRALRYRLGIIAQLLAGTAPGTLLEIGCGSAMHLFALAHRFRHCIGVDLSARMIAVAEAARRRHPLRDRIELFPAPAETLQGVRDASIDVALGVGVLEHIPDQAAALAQLRRVLKPGGAFVCLTPNAGFVWYRRLAPRLGWPCRYLSSDRFLDAADVRRLVREAGLGLVRLDYWRFVPRGDLPWMLGWGLTCLDWPGRWLNPAALRGGLGFKAVRRAHPAGE